MMSYGTTGCFRQRSKDTTDLGTFKRKHPMRRYRNARYAPESLERKLNPSGMGIVAPPALVSPSVAPSDPSLIVDDSEGYGFDGTDYTVDYSTADDLSSSGSDTTPYTAPMSDYLLVDDGDDAPTTPEDGPAPILPPLVPTGPALPA
jgi:hypothetical protein